MPTTRVAFGAEPASVPSSFSPPGSRSLLGWAGGGTAGALGLTLPAILLILVGLVAPIGLFLVRSVANPEIATGLPRTVAVLGDWDGTGMPPEAAFSALGEDLRVAAGSGRLGEIARRLNFVSPGYRTLVMRTGTRLAAGGTGAAASPRDLVALDARWGEPVTWARIRQESGSLTGAYYLAALDLRREPDGRIGVVEEANRLFLSLFARTLLISLSVTVLCLAIGYPVAYVIASAPARWTPLLLTLILVPFWTSTLVRSTAWIVLLQGEGLINRTLRWLGLIEGSLPLFANRFAVLVAMTHVLLPYMILPLYGVMKGVPPDLVRAASNLGADPWRAFRRVYVPQTLPGIAAGTLLVFILALGYYVTPALVGGASDQMVSYFIALYTNQSLNWGLASALGTILLVLTGLLYAAFGRFGSLRSVT